MSSSDTSNRRHLMAAYIDESKAAYIGGSNRLQNIRKLKKPLSSICVVRSYNLEREGIYVLGL
jgi:hypothetical protein